MSNLRTGDERLHYSDSSHRWIAPRNVDQTAWDAGMRAHLYSHLATMGGPADVDGLRSCRLPHAPTTRTPAPSAKKAVTRRVNGKGVAARGR